ncbi:MAG: 7TM diverse intracellular signaling domain-containing protein [Burkholderiales bacterium]
MKRQWLSGATRGLMVWVWRLLGWLACPALLALAYAPVTGAAEPTIRATDIQASGLAIGRYMAGLDDPTGRMDIAAAAAPGRAAAYTAMTTDRPNFGYHPSPYWLRFTIDPGTRGAHLMLEIGMPSLDHVDLYVPAPDGGFTRVSAGDRLPWSARPVAHRHFVFDLSLAPGSAQTFYLRVESRSVLTVPAALWQPEAFAMHNRHSQLFLGLFYGLLVGLFAYNLIVWSTLRDPLYLIYVAYVGCFGLALFTFDGLAFEHLWPDDVAWANCALATFMSLSLAFGALFSRGFLDTRRRMPRVDVFSRSIAAAALVLALLAATDWWLDYGQVLRALSGLAAVGAVVTLVTAVKIFLDGYRPARYFLLAWSALLIFILLGALRNFGWLPTNFATFYGLHVGLALDVILLSTALADRIRALAEERLHAQADLLATTRRHDEESRARARDLAAANEQLEAFSYSVAHDLRAPLRAIDGFSQLLKVDAGPALSSEAQSNIERISASARRMARLIDGLLEFARLGRVAPVSAPVDMRAELDAALREIGHSPVVELEIGPLPIVEGDAAMLRQVWFNLLANALKFSAGAKPPRVQVLCEESAAERVFSVADNGAGFDPAYADKLFGMFQRLHAATEFEGTGVGLAIVKRIVEAHGGRIWASGTPGQGATFRFALPKSRALTKAV